MNKKRWLTLAFSILLAIVAALQFSVALKAKGYTTYQIDVVKGSPITGITINNSRIDLTRYVNNDIKLKDEKLCSDTRGTITIMTSVIDNIFIKYDNNAKDMFVTKDGVEMKSNDTLFAYSTNILNDIKVSINMYTAIFIITFIPVFYILLWYVIRFITKLKEGDFKLYRLILTALSIFILYVCTFYILLYAMRYYVAIIPIICIGAILWYLKDTFKEKKENIYISIVIIAGITMLFIIPPFHVPDEYAHFIKSYYMTASEKNGTSRENIPVSIDNFSFKYIQGMTDRSIKYNGKNYLSDLLEDGNYSKLSEYEKGYGNTFNLSILPYALSAITVGIARVLNLSPLLLILIVKLTDLILTIVLGYIAIKNTPKFKNIFLIALLLPMTLHQTAAINMDYLTNIMTILFTAFVFKYKWQDGKMNNYNKILLGVIALAIAYCKFGYFPFLLLVLLIPNDKFKSKSEAVLYKGCLILIPSLLSYIQNSGFGGTDSPYYSLSYMIKHPYRIFQIYYNTAVERLPLDIFTGQFDGFGLSTKWLPSLYSTISVFIFVILYSIAGNNEELKVVDRLSILFVGLLIIAAIYTGLLVGWTPVGSWTVNGLQPRYFLPATFLILIACSNDFIRLNVKNKERFISGSLFIIYTISLYFIMKGFY